jgi:hypothetical protein
MSGAQKTSKFSSSVLYGRQKHPSESDKSASAVSNALWIHTLKHSLKLQTLPQIVGVVSGS